jgi:hypothetical protein
MNNLIIQTAILATGIAYILCVLFPLFGVFAGALKALKVAKEEAQGNIKKIGEPIPVA